jgi:DNA-directed RNA polymerase beta' subunit
VLCESSLHHPCLLCALCLRNIRAGEEVQEQATVEIYDHNLYDPQPGRLPTANGPLDAHLGTVSKTELCVTCGLDQMHCNGHWGTIELYYPCFHIGFLAFTVEILNQICKVSDCMTGQDEDCADSVDLFANFA